MYLSRLDSESHEARVSKDVVGFTTHTRSYDLIHSDVTRPHSHCEMTTTRISFSTAPFKASSTPLAGLIGRLPDPYAERMTARQVGTASICAERRVPVMPGWMEHERTVGEVTSGTRRGGREGVRGGREGSCAGKQTGLVRATTCGTELGSLVASSRGRVGVTMVTKGQEELKGATTWTVTPHSLIFTLRLINGGTHGDWNAAKRFGDVLVALGGR